MRFETDLVSLMLCKETGKYFFVLFLLPLPPQVRSPGDEVLVGPSCRPLVYDVPGGNRSLRFTRFGVPIVKVRIYIAMEDGYILLSRSYEVK